MPAAGFFSNPATERRFLLHYCAAGAWGDQIAVVLWLTACLVFLIKERALPARCAAAAPPLAAASQTCGSAIGNKWMTYVIFPSSMVLCVVCGMEGYTLLRGRLTVVHRLLLAAGLAFSMRPSCCKLCPMLWRHRVLFYNSACVIAHTPAALYWIGGLLCWLVATLVDVADPQATCGPSLPCLISALQAMLASVAAHHPVLQAQKVVAALFSSSSLAHLGDALVPGLVLTCLELRARRDWAARHTVQPQQQHGQPAGAVAVALQHQACGSSGSSSSDKAVSSKHPKRLEQCDSSPLEPGSGASSRQGVIDKNSTAQAASAAEAASVQLQRAPSRPATATRRVHVPAPADAAAAVAAASALRRAVQQRLANGLPVYSSPVSTRVVSFKLKDPPGAGADDYESLKQQLTAALQSHSTDIAAGTGDDNCGSQVTSTTAFPGCWQLVFQAVSACSRSAATLQDPQQNNQSTQDAAMQHQQQQQPLNQLAQQVLQSWQGWEVLDVQQLEAPWANIADAGGVQAASQAAFTTELLQAAALYLQPAAIMSAAQHDAASSQHSGSGSRGSTSVAASSVELCVPAAVVQQLLAAGQCRLRVVVAQQPNSSVLLDQTWQLQQPAAAAAAAAAPAAGGLSSDAVVPASAAATEPGDLRLQLQLQLGNTVANTARAGCRVLCAAVMTGGTAALPGHVLAQLPLLVLPAGAQLELQGLLDAAAAAGLDDSQAYLEVLPLLQDWATLMLWPVTGASAQSSGSSSGSRRRRPERQLLAYLYEELFESVTACLDEYELTECYKLVIQQHWEWEVAAEAAQKRRHALEAEQQQKLTPPAAEAAVQGSVGLRRRLVRHDTPAVAAAVAAAATTTTATPAAAAAIMDVGQAGTSSSCSAIPKAQGRASCCAPEGYVETGKAADSDGGPYGGCNSKFGTVCLGFPATPTPLQLQAAAVRVSLMNVPLGFPDPPAVQQVYTVYKAAVLQRQDLAAAVGYLLITFVLAVKFGVLLGSEAANMEQQLLIWALKAAYALVSAASHALLWLATCCQQKCAPQQRPFQQRCCGLLRMLIHWRDSVLLAAPLLMVLVMYACMWQGGPWGSAACQLALGSWASPVVFVLFKFVARPLLCRFSVPGMLGYSLLPLLLVFSACPNPGFEVALWFHPTYCLLVAAGMLLAAVLEAKMQRDFVRSLHAEAAHRQQQCEQQ